LKIFETPWMTLLRLEGVLIKFSLSFTLFISDMIKQVHSEEEENKALGRIFFT